ncbi:MAG: hypothetical protein AAGF97_10230 [Planctomycetota bacterium]
MPFYRVAASIITGLLANALLAEESPVRDNVPTTEQLAKAQLFEQMGPYHRPFSTNSPEAQQYLDQGMVWIQAFNHDEARRCFLKAAELDPSCAWAWWGVAFCEGPNYNDPKPDDNRSRAAWYALQNALARIDNASDVERDLITALKSRYANPWPQDRSELDAAYAEAMADVWERHPQDADVGALYAESMMQLKPWQLYSQEREPVEGTMKIRGVLETVMQLDPEHAGARHLYIHAVEPSARPDDALTAAAELANLVPASGHLLHMPSHIYVQTGNWQQAIDQNIKAVASDREFRDRSTGHTIQYGYQFHNAHMLVFAAMMVGQEKLAMEYARELWTVFPEEQLKLVGPELDFSLMCVYDVQKRFGRWDDILAEPQPLEELVVTNAFWRAHRAIAYAAKHQFEEAEREYVEFLKAKEEVPADSMEEGTFNHQALKVAQHFVQGEIALQQENWPVAIWHLERAAEIEDTLRYGEPPYWLQPVRHALGAAQMKAGQFADAEQTYRTDLRLWRDNGWSLYGLSQALEAQDKHDEAAVVLADFKRVWANADEPLLTTSCKCVENLQGEGG